MSTVPSMTLYDSVHGCAWAGGPLSRGPVISKISNAPPVSPPLASTRMVSPTTWCFVPSADPMNNSLAVMSPSVGTYGWDGRADWSVRVTCRGPDEILSVVVHLLVRVAEDRRLHVHTRRLSP